MDTVQALLIAVVIVLTIMLVVIGYQVFYILRELRKTIDRVNKVLHNAESITDSVKAPVNTVSAMLVGLKSGTVIADLLKKLREKKKELPSGDLPAGRQGKSS